MAYREPIMGVYAITHAATGGRYIGSSAHIHRRFSQHRADLNHNKSRHSGLQVAWNTYGADAFVFEVLEVVTDPTTLHEVEQRWLDQTPIRFNRCVDTANSRSYGPLSDESRARMRSARLRYLADPDHFTATVKQLVDWRALPDAHERLSAASKKRVSTPEYRQHIGEKVRAYKQSEEGRRQQSESQKKRFANPEERRKASERRKGKPRPESANIKIRESLDKRMADPSATWSTSGMRGVSWNRKDRVWRVRLTVDGQVRNFGHYKTLEEARAVAARIIAERAATSAS